MLMSNQRAQWADGQAILNWSWFGTVVFCVAAIPATIWPSWFQWPFMAVSMGMFLAGTVLLAWALWIAVQRSRYFVVGIGGLFFTVGSAPVQVQKILLSSLCFEVVVGFLAATLRIYTPVTFGILAPVWALGLTSLWCARFGSFEVRQNDQRNG